jgi:hypothetical protein
MIYRMFFKILFRPKYLLGVLFAAMALVAFNLGQPGIERDTASAFNKWYQNTSTKLTQTQDSNNPGLSLGITITLKGPGQLNPPNVWNLPETSLSDPNERENTIRALQLVSESGIFGFAPLRNPSPDTPSLSLTVKDTSDTEAPQKFEIVIPFSAVEENIQLRNLLKLLEIHSTQQDITQVEPARL